MQRSIKVVLSVLIATAFAGGALSQPQPAAKTGGAAPAKDIAVPNAPNYPTAVSGRSLEDWIKEIDNPDPSVREQAIMNVLAFGPSARKAIPAITGQVKQLNDIGPQAHAIMALSDLIPLAPPPPPGGAADPWATQAVNALISVLRSPQAVIRYRAATALGYIGPQGRAAVSYLVPLVTDISSWEIRKAACFALGRVGWDEQGYPMIAALDALTRGIEDRESKGVRLEALQSVIILGPPAPPRLLEALKRRMSAERDKTTAIWVRVANIQFNAAERTDKNIGQVAKEIKSNDPDVRLVAIKAVGLMGQLAKIAVPDLLDALAKADNPEVRVELCRALGRMGQYAERAIPALESLQSQENESVKTAARKAADDIKKGMETAKQQPAQPPKKGP